VGGYSLVQELLGHTVTEWGSSMISKWFVGSLQLIGMGIRIIGESIGEVYHEVKQCPRYVIAKDTFS
jgi:polyisoprenyl-phosphate glycosyltransferase